MLLCLLFSIYNISNFFQSGSKIMVLPKYIRFIDTSFNIINITFCIILMMLGKFNKYFK